MNSSRSSSRALLWVGAALAVALACLALVGPSTASPVSAFLPEPTPDPPALALARAQYLRAMVAFHAESHEGHITLTSDQASELADPLDTAVEELTTDAHSAIAGCALLNEFIPSTRSMQSAGILDFMDAVPMIGTAQLAVDQIQLGPDACDEPPVVTGITADLDPVRTDTTVDVSAVFVDDNDNDQHEATIDWGDGASSDAQVHQATNSITGSHAYTQPGVYSVTVTVYAVESGVPGESGAGVFGYIVVYDPDGGHVTGGGWIESPAEACPDFCGGATGTAKFGFVSMYHKGADVPTGNTEFQFQAGHLNFKSTSYEWLVVAGAQAKFKGIGTIKNSSGTYQFMVTAIDGQVSGGGDVDGFRIKITGAGGVVYDNKMGAADDAPDFTALDFGSIDIKKQ